MSSISLVPGQAQVIAVTNEDATTVQVTNPVVQVIQVISEGPQGIPGSATGGDKHFAYTQSQPSASWNIRHGLGKQPSITVVDSTGDVVYGDVIVSDLNNVTINFSGAFSGSAYFN